MCSRVLAEEVPRTAETEAGSRQPVLPKNSRPDQALIHDDSLEPPVPLGPQLLDSYLQHSRDA